MVEWMGSMFYEFGMKVVLVEKFIIKVMNDIVI